jgi:hypothetical protein
LQEEEVVQGQKMQRVKPLSALVERLRRAKTTKRAGSSDALSKYCGFYESYHIDSLDDKRVIVRSSVEIQHGKPLQVRMKSFGYNYKGHILEKAHNLFVFFEGDGHEEYMLFVLNTVPTPQFDVLTGVFAAIAENQVPAAGKTLWHKVEGPCVSEQLWLSECEPAIVKFLDQPGNPIKIRKVNAAPYLSKMPI